jgi:DNA-directed RNA polymerase subunit N (RpoN/RPB10)
MMSVCNDDNHASDELKWITLKTVSAAFPDRCTLCNKVLGHLMDLTTSTLAQQEPNVSGRRSFNNVWPVIGVESECCKKEIMTYYPRDVIQHAYDLMDSSEPADFYYGQYVQITNSRNHPAVPPNEKDARPNSRSMAPTYGTVTSSYYLQ